MILSMLSRGSILCANIIGDSGGEEEETHEARHGQRAHERERRSRKQHDPHHARGTI